MDEEERIKLRKEGWKGGMENALEIIGMCTTFDGRRTHRKYTKKILDAIQECIDYDN